MATKRDFIKKLAEKMGCTETAAKKFMNAYVDLATELLQEGDEINIHYFGKLYPIEQSERPGRNLRTGEECMIRARTSVRFRPSEILIGKLNNTEV